MAKRIKTPEELQEIADEKARLQATKLKYTYKDPNRKTKKALSPMENQEQNTETNTPAGTEQTPAQTVATETTTPTPEVKQNAPAFGQPNKKYNPLDGNTKQRSHSTPVINTEIKGEIPEAEYTLPVINEANIEATLANKNAGGALPGMESTAQNTQNGANPNSAAQQTPLSNPAVNTMTPEETTLAATQMADTIIGAYDKLHGFGRFIIKVDEENLILKEREGKINLKTRLPISIDKKTNMPVNITLGEWTTEFNKEVDSEFVLSRDFKESVRPALIRTCAKHGWLLSDDQYILYKFGEDAATKIAMIVGFKRSIGKFYKMFELAHEESKKEMNDTIEAKVEKLFQARMEAAARVAELHKTATPVEEIKPEINNTPVAETETEKEKIAA